MNFDDIYDYTFNKLMKIVRTRRTRAVELSRQSTWQQHLMFNLGNSEAEEKVHRSVYASLEDYAPRAMSDLLIMMLARLDSEETVGCVTPVYGSLDEPELSYSVPHFAITQNGKTVGFVCAHRLKRPRDLADLGLYKEIENLRSAVRRDIKRGVIGKDSFIADILDCESLPQLDSIKCLLLVDDKSRDEELSRIDSYNEWAGKSPGLQINVSYELFGDFFARYFGVEEFARFSDKVADFNKSVWEEAAVGLVEIPTTSRLEILKEEYLRRIIDEVDSYRGELEREGLNNGQFDAVRKRFFDEGLYFAFLGDASFADSFISSEWMRGLHRLTDTLDQTGTVAGYLKSVEQLLYLMVKQWKGSGKRIPKHYDKNTGEYDCWEEFDDRYPNRKMERLQGGTLSNFFDPKANSGVLHLTGDSAAIPARLLRDFTNNDRNGYFHKHNLHCAYESSESDSIGSTERELNELERIRHRAMLLHFLILGCCVINESGRESLMIPSESLSMGTLVTDIESRVRVWVERAFNNPVLRYRIESGAESIVFTFDHVFGREADWTEVLMRCEGEYWELKIALYERVADARNQIPMCRGGYFVEDSSVRWQEKSQREPTFKKVYNLLLSLDWEALLSWTECNPSVILRDRVHGEIDLRTGLKIA